MMVDTERGTRVLEMRGTGAEGDMCGQEGSSRQMRRQHRLRLRGHAGFRLFEGEGPYSYLRRLDVIAGSMWTILQLEVNRPAPAASLEPCAPAHKATWRRGKKTKKRDKREKREIDW